MLFFVIKRLITELKMGFVDMLKLAQYINLIFHFSIGLVVFTLGIFRVGFDTYSIKF